MVRFLFLLMVISLPLSLGSCQRNEPATVTAKDVQEKTADAARTAAGYARQEKDEYIRKMQKEIDELKVDIDNLRRRAKTASDKVKTALDSEIEVSEEKWRVAEEKFSELKSAGADAWEGLKAGIEQAMKDLRQSLAKARQESE